MVFVHQVITEAFLSPTPLKYVWISAAVARQSFDLLFLLCADGDDEFSHLRAYANKHKCSPVNAHTNYFAQKIFFYSHSVPLFDLHIESHR